MARNDGDYKAAKGHLTVAPFSMEGRLTITSYDNRRQYSGDGSTTVFSFSPPFTTQTDLVVQVQAVDGSLTTKVLGTDYILSSPPYTAGCSVTMSVAPALTTTLIIYRDVSLTQPVDLQDGGPLPAATVNRALDRITMWGQRLREMADRAFANATQTVAGLMSAADKYKLDSIEAGAQVNVVTSVAGKTGAVTLVKADVGLGNVDNTSDVNKPVSTAQAAADALALRAAQNLNDLSNKTTARTNLGVAIGTDVQAFNARLADIAAIAWQQGDVLYHNGTALVRLAAGTSGQFLRTAGAGASPVWASIPGGGDMLRANNLSDVANVATARANIGAGTVTSIAMTVPAFLNVSGAPIMTSGTFAVALSGTALPVANGGTGLTSAGTAGQILTVVSGSPAWADQVTFRAPDLWVRCERTQGTLDTPADLTAGAYITRALNTVKRNVIPGASVSSNQITLPAGTYYVRWRTPAFSTGGVGVGSTTRSKLYNVTASTNIDFSTSANSYTNSTSTDMTTSGETTFTLATTSNIDLRHITASGSVKTGQIVNGTGEPEIYSSVELWKVG